MFNKYQHLLMALEYTPMKNLRNSYMYVFEKNQL